jgi:glutathionyl-hydroquinone reductase
MAEVVDRTQNQRGGERTAPTVYHIPVCPFSQRLEILLTLKDLRHLLDFHVLDITRPRPGWLLEKTGARRPCRCSRPKAAGSSRRAW